MENLQEPQNIDFVELLFDFERRLKEGVIKTERIEKGKIKITVLRKHPFEADVTIGEVTGVFSESQIEDLALDQDIKIANLKKQLNEITRSYLAQIEQAENGKNEQLQAVLSEIKRLDKEFEEEQKDKKK